MRDSADDELTLFLLGGSSAPELVILHGGPQGISVPKFFWQTWEFEARLLKSLEVRVSTECGVGIIAAEGFNLR